MVSYPGKKCRDMPLSGIIRRREEMQRAPDGA
jgi:hypothetical protein